MPTGWGKLCFSSKNHRYKINKWINKNKSFVFSPAFKVVCSSFILFGLGAFFFSSRSDYQVLLPSSSRLSGALSLPLLTSWPILSLSWLIPVWKPTLLALFTQAKLAKNLYIESIWEVGKSWEDDFPIKPWSSHKTSWTEPLRTEKDLHGKPKLGSQVLMEFWGWLLGL